MARNSNGGGEWVGVLRFIWPVLVIGGAISGVMRNQGPQPPALPPPVAVTATSASDAPVPASPAAADSESTVYLPGVSATKGAVLPPDWIRGPSDEAVRRAYPPAAWKEGRGAVIFISCRIRKAGRLGDCRADGPEGSDAAFKAAALSLAGRVSVRPDPNLVGARVSVPIVFRSPHEPEALMWTRAPTENEIADAYPEAARRQAVAGGAKVRCSLSRMGETTGCQVISETPTGFGFGPAALRLADRYQAGTAAAGQPIRTVVLPFDFQPSDQLIEEARRNREQLARWGPAHAIGQAALSGALLLGAAWLAAVGVLAFRMRRRSQAA